MHLCNGETEFFSLFFLSFLRKEIVTSVDHKLRFEGSDLGMHASLLKSQRVTEQLHRVSAIRSHT